MNPRLLDHYKRELQHVREMGGEFAAEFPKIAGRLGLETLECADPYVERLLEGFAFIAARVQLKLETSEARLARHLLEMVHPTALAPTPSMAVVELTPSFAEGSLAHGASIPRGTRLRSRLGPEERTECDFRTAHELTLWPIEVRDLRVLPSAAAIAAAGVGTARGARSALALELGTVGGYRFSELPIETLSFHLRGPEDTGAALHEQLFRHTRAVAAVDGDGCELRSPRQGPRLGREGFEDGEALLPVTARGFQGHRLLQEYFAFPERFHFARLGDLGGALGRCESDTVRLVFLRDSPDEGRLERFGADNVRLHCTPAINLFAKTADRIHVDGERHEYHVVPDRTRPLDFEVYEVIGVDGYGRKRSRTQRFGPYHAVSERRRSASAFFGTTREPRRLSSRQRRIGPRASYVGSEVFLSLVDADAAPYRSDLRQLAVETLCTNRDLPLQMPVGKGDTDFKLDIGAPVERVRCVVGPTAPRASRAQGDDTWRLVSSLGLNHLSIDDGVDADGGRAAAAMLRQMLELHVGEDDGPSRRQLDGVVSVATRPAVRQRRSRARLEIARGLEIRVRVDESAFEGSGAYLFGAVLERYFTRHASINAFTETVLESVQRGELERWPVRLGERGVL